jgi:hypothetical protein
MSVDGTFRAGTLPLAAFCAAFATGVFAAETPAVYETPQDALEAMVSALESKDREALLNVFGTSAEDLLYSGNPERDALIREIVMDAYREGYRFAPRDEGGVELILGADDWPFPVPIAELGDGWAFDVEAGRDEVLFRRIGLNELEAIELIAAYVDIQAEYRLVDHDGDGVMEFAASILSSDEDARDGLVWAAPDSPLGERIALASLDGYSEGGTDYEAEPFGGYYYRILDAQGPAAPGGEMDYVIGGNMVAGHALLAVPADYGSSGIHSFMVSENGVILQADLGEESLDIGFETRRYDPGDDWVPVD